MKITETTIQGVLVLEPKVFGDHRGSFMECYNQQVFRSLGLDFSLVQDNQSFSREIGTIRGLHYQLAPKAQTKIVRVLRGAIFDVAVDLRQGSPTYGKWVGVSLSAENKKQLLIPQGFAHAFCTTAVDTEVFYKVDNFYAPECERGIMWNDPDLAIGWPTSEPVLSEKDTKYPLFQEAENNFTFSG